MQKAIRTNWTASNKAFRYLKKQGVDLNVNLDALQTEYDKLKATHSQLAGQLATVKEELQPMKDIRYWGRQSPHAGTGSREEARTEALRNGESEVPAGAGQETAGAESSAAQKTEYGTLTGTCRFLCENVECLFCFPKG